MHNFHRRLLGWVPVRQPQEAVPCGEAGGGGEEGVRQRSWALAQSE